ncbi:MAG TPA: T9SS type A sorting domain-containing protein, partial [Bacteroidetes bacterium]|nr:T9SS type A sorting domain-containing protein [Bacteroidota bacterium]HEX03896.1 T9SS type A sorting domain-containing protein [Bacteroidota bacterium]
DRGVYRTLNGGDDWEQVLFINDTTGCIDIEINPNFPDSVFAVMWQRYRNPAERSVSGPNSGLWRSIDGGDNWDRLTNGLPTGDNVGRGSLAIAPTSPDFLVLTHTDHPGYFIGGWKTDDGGDSWEDMDGLDPYGHDIYNSFGWYFGESIIEPSAMNTIYIGGLYMYKSTTLGDTWEQVFDWCHVDHHAFNINPNDPAKIISGHDGGVNVSYDRGDHSTRFSSLAATQFYAITHDPSIPHRLYGGTQDNGTMRTTDGSIDNWDYLYGGDGFYCLVDPRDSDVIYICMQWGGIRRTLDGGNNWDSIGWDMSGDRTNWMTPYIFDPHNYDRLYYGTYRVWGTTNRGNSWNDISPDLTDGDDPGGLTYGTITSLSASPVEPGLILVGTDDANVWYTDDFGGDWTRIDQELPDIWVSRVATHPDSANVFFVALSGHRISEPQPHLYRSDDYGQTWHAIVGETPETMLPDGPINDVIIDPDDTALIYVATDFGVFASMDYGQSWGELGEGLPMSAVFDIDFIASQRRLIAGTHGRSMYSIGLGELEVEKSPRELPVSERMFLTSYPNPFNGTSTIRMSVPVAQSVDVQVFDLLGRQVAVISQNQRIPAGISEWSWTAQTDAGISLASGTYIVVATTDSQQISRRVQLVK